MIIRMLVAIGTLVGLGFSFATASAQDNDNISLLTLNIGGGGGQEGSDGQDVDWPTRVRRLANWATGNKPDIIALQEFWGWMNISWLPLFPCGGWNEDRGDYDFLDYLVRDLALTTGVTYRVAYLSGYQTTARPLGICDVYGSQVMLYNPQRLINLTAQDTSETSIPHDAQRSSRLKHFRRSLPLCDRRTSFMPLGSLIDGPPQTDKCGRETPSGPVWASLAVEWERVIATFIRFAFKHDTSRTIGVFNIHPLRGTGNDARPAIVDFIASQEPSYSRSFTHRC